MYSVVYTLWSRRLFIQKPAGIAAIILLLAITVAADVIPRAKRIIISCPTSSIEDFERLANEAKQMGATDIDISDLPKDRWQWFDPADPYPNWSMLQASILKIMVPKALQPDVPTGNAIHCQQILAQRGEVLRRLGLKASFRGAEPMWLPEGVYQRHPTWRGPRCQSPIRARHDYFAPCIDQPEVLDMYRQATADLCKLVPIEEFFFLGNDSGTGICWHPGLYPGANGPAFCKGRPMADRLNGFMAALQEGAKDAGEDATIHFAGTQLLASSTSRPVFEAGLISAPWASKCYPAVNIPDPVQFAVDIEQAFAHPDSTWKISIPTPDSTEYFAVLDSFIHIAIKGPLGREQALNAAAAKMVGDASASNLLQAWHDIHDTIDLIRTIDNGGPILLLGSVNQRWLVRPLVPYPLELLPEEKDYYRRFQFQAQTEADAANLMNVQGLFAINGDAGTAQADALFRSAIKSLRHATQELDAIKASAPEEGVIGALNLRIQALILVIQNADITARYQAFLDRFRPEWMSRPDRNGYPEPELGVKLVAEDVANTQALIDLIQSTQLALIDAASTTDEEDVFRLGPDLVEQLKLKIKIEQKYAPSHQRLLHP